MPLKFASPSRSWPISMVGWCCLILVYLQLVRATDVSFTIEVAAGSRDCFHQPLKKDVQYESEYQVLDGGDLDITFYINTQSGQAVVFDERKSGEVHRLTAAETGDYKICFDNVFSHFTPKVVFFELVSDNDDDDDEDEEKLFGNLPDNTDYEVSLDKVKDALEKIHNGLQKSIQIQKLFSAIESRDRAISENNFERVNFWSSLQVFVMISAAAANVVLIRGLFSSRDKAAHGTKVRT